MRRRTSFGMEEDDGEHEQREAEEQVKVQKDKEGVLGKLRADGGDQGPQAVETAPPILSSTIPLQQFLRPSALLRRPHCQLTVSLCILPSLLPPVHRREHTPGRPTEPACSSFFRPRLFGASRD
jgi:hypothetical protein